MLKSLSTVWPYLRRYRKGLGLGIASFGLNRFAVYRSRTI